MKSEMRSVLNREYVSLFIVNIIVSMSFYMLSTTVAMYSKQIGLTPELIGTVVGSLSIASLCVRPFTGIISDSMNGKWLLIISLLLIAGAVIGCSMTSSFSLLILFRVLHGIGFSMATTITMALVSGTIPAMHMTQGLGYFAIGQTISSAIAPSIGLAMGTAFGFETTFRLAAGLLILSSILAVFLVSPTAHTSCKNEKSLRLNRLFAKEALPFCALAIIVAGCTGLENSYVALLGDALLLGNIGWYFSLGAVTLFLTRLFGGRIIDRNRWALPVCLGFMSLAFALLGATQSGMGMYVLLAMLGVAALLKAMGLGMVQPALQAGSVNSVAVNRRGAASSTYYLGTDIGQALSPMIGGFLASRLGYQGMFLASSLPVLLSAVIVVLYYIKGSAKNED